MTLDELAQKHDELVADFHRATDNGEETSDIWDAIAVVEMAYCGHPDRPVWTDEQLADAGWGPLAQ